MKTIRIALAALALGVAGLTGCSNSEPSRTVEMPAPDPSSVAATQAAVQSAAPPGPGQPGAPVPGVAGPGAVVAPGAPGAVAQPGGPGVMVNPASQPPPR